MIAYKQLIIIAIWLGVMVGSERLHGEGDVTVVSASSVASTPAKKQSTASDGTPVVHKSLHKKKHAVASGSGASPAAGTGAGSTVTSSSVTPAAPTSAAPHPSATASEPAAATKMVDKTAPIPSVTASIQSAPAPSVPPRQPSATIAVTPVHAFDPNPLPPLNATAASAKATGPTVETGLPVARPGSEVRTGIVSLPAGVKVPAGKPLTGSTTHQPLYAGAFPPVGSLTSSAIGLYSPSNHTTHPASDFAFTNFPKRPRNVYPWKTGIITTMFYIGEPGSNLSPTDNIASAWDENWRSSNRGNDSPYDRNGYAPADHAPTVNTFYVALPFNDLAYPDKARRWLPTGWHATRDRDGKQVSACKDRWVEIKNSQGRTCYAQWEDVGPLVSDHAEYVFGDERPDTLTRAGLDVSPAVADYLGVTGNSRLTSWRFVEAEDVQPGAWLRYEELAILFRGMHEQKNVIPSYPPIQRSSEPMDDPSSVEANKKKVDASKG